ncbi:50S ribosomal protein L30 [Haloplasma contractile]|uniref:50S ribosomal protein L30 n=1 Tax=Haloplasma contractile SSD-17B TaxID=1033810 RepID=U2FHR3_9MOLU|nr:50S ribosomal protein L30 [Haloplasma contractile]ERJ12370.1 50S ribosomal protein L30 [Haloplasma contractile SSD-17B]
MENTLEITLVRSLIGVKPNQRKTAEALGLTRPNKVVVKPNNENVRGMINTISHLVKVEEK